MTMGKVTKGTMGKVTMGRMMVTGMLVAIWSPGGCVPCGAGQPPLLSLAPTPKPPTPSLTLSQTVKPASYLVLGSLKLGI